MRAPWLRIGLAFIVALLLLSVSPHIVRATAYVVTTNADSGLNSLRDAITQVNTLGTGGDTITFNIVGTPTITLLSPLPPIQKGVCTHQ